MVKVNGKNLTFIDELADDRLSFIRRSCGMDRTNVLTLNISKAIINMDQILKTIHESVVMKSRDREKSIKKKRIKSTAPRGKLSVNGWNARYDFKIGLMCELRKDFENAIKLTTSYLLSRNYTNAYNGVLALIKASLNVNPGAEREIPAYGKRFEEALSLIDSINFKISQLHFYNNAGVSAHSQMLSHIVNCKDFPHFESLRDSKFYDDSITPGIRYLSEISAGGSFEYWDWVSRLYF